MFDPAMLDMLPKHNTTIEAADDSFYVSYNFADVSIYGDVTTSLVWGQFQHFYILNGNHLEEYRKLIPLGWDACMAYFKEHIDQINVKFSKKPPA